MALLFLLICCQYEKYRITPDIFFKHGQHVRLHVNWLVGFLLCLLVGDVA